MTTYGEVFRNLIKEAEKEIQLASTADHNGDLWSAKLHLNKAMTNLKEADTLILDVSKTAFERVFNEKAR